MKSRVIAISAISASFIAVILTLGAYFSVLDLVSIILASAFVILPLYYKSYWGSFLAYLAGGVLAFLFSGFNLLSVVVPSYMVFFGIYPIVKHKMMEKNFNKILSFVINLVWFVAVVYGMYFYYTFVMGLTLDRLPEWISNYILIFVGVLAIPVYFLYERYVIIVKRIADKYLNRIVDKRK